MAKMILIFSFGSLTACFGAVGVTDNVNAVQLHITEDHHSTIHTKCGTCNGCRRLEMCRDLARHPTVNEKSCVQNGGVWCAVSFDGNESSLGSFGRGLQSEDTHSNEAQAQTSTPEYVGCFIENSGDYYRQRSPQWCSSFSECTCPPKYNYIGFTNGRNQNGQQAEWSCFHSPPPQSADGCQVHEGWHVGAPGWKSSVYGPLQTPTPAPTPEPPTPPPTPAPTGWSDPTAALLVSGAPACLGWSGKRRGISLNGYWLPLGVTQTGARYYKMQTQTLYLYFDPDCDGKKMGNYYTTKWIIDSSPPSQTASKDLDGDGDCNYFAYQNVARTSPTLGPSRWTVVCDGRWERYTITISQGEAPPDSRGHLKTRDVSANSKCLYLRWVKHGKMSATMMKCNQTTWSPRWSLVTGQIKTRFNNWCLDNRKDNSVGVSRCSKTKDNQKWFKGLINEQLRTHDGKCLEKTENDRWNFQDVHVALCHGGDNQKWFMEPVSDAVWNQKQRTDRKMSLLREEDKDEEEQKYEEEEKEDMELDSFS